MKKINQLIFSVATLMLAQTFNPAWAVPNITTLSDADSNTAGGSAVLQNTTGGSNTGFGARALENNTSGSRNTATGQFSLFSNTTGTDNTANGFLSLQLNTTGKDNTAIGSAALDNNTVGNDNTASGFFALLANTTGNNNTANGTRALQQNTSGTGNTALGFASLQFSTTANKNTALGGFALNANAPSAHNNTAVGFQALKNKVAGTGNVAIGGNAGFTLKSGNNNIYIANIGVASESSTIRIGVPGHARTFIGGIRGRKTAVANAVPVLIDANGQLGTANSSERFKKDVHDMKEASHKLLELRPVTYRYKQAEDDGTHPLEYGLIAEEVAKVYPDLVAYDVDGKIETVQYQKLTPLLLNEIKHLHSLSQQQSAEIANLTQQITALKTQVRDVSALSARLTKIEAQQMVVLNR